MLPISAEIVEATWQKMATIPPSQAQKLIEQMSRQQPLILAYLMAAGDDLLNHAERELLLYMGVVIWQMMEQGDKRPATVTETLLEETDQRNLKMLEYLAGDSEQEFIDTVQALLDSCNQREVLRYAIETLMEGEEELDEEFELEREEPFAYDDDAGDEPDDEANEFAGDDAAEDDDDDLEEESDGSVRDEMKGMMMLYLKTVIDCLDQ
ncbi:MAG: hypothetical protein ONB48_09430 [candidate division KSB1 bacterium]|nr:hypothetical protein [candidate division KSB1 bacterium]MDZ7273707.1 hypothetical protein [candidate division KSB1 bacterium]MDZ7285863.1 hypothetical protein [candidate division KSB1 bacterium]MDZ7298895.1 hypothetical protein [candidate division KSB1 bacterium]MDZ7309455.1 hypothetical protein [candidate division KSB1 bacterium]